MHNSPRYLVAIIHSSDSIGGGDKSGDHYYGNGAGGDGGKSKSSGSDSEAGGSGDIRGDSSIIVIVLHRAKQYGRLLHFSMLSQMGRKHLVQCCCIMLHVSILNPASRLHIEKMFDCTSTGNSFYHFVVFY